MNTIYRFKSRKIIKAQLGTLLKKGWNWLQNSAQTAVIAESPAVMTASGWRVDKNGKAKQDQQNTKEVKQLRNNLATIGEAGVTAPTLVGDVEGLYNVVRHPVQTFKTIQKTGQDALWFLRNPGAVKVYHGNTKGDYFPLQEARTASPTDVGIHVSPKKEIAQSKNYQDTQLMEAWIPKHDMETLDLGYNNYYLISNEAHFPYNRPGKTFTKFEQNILNKYGDRNIKLRDKTLPNLSRDQRIEAERLVKKGKNANNGSAAREVNQEVSDFLSNNGKKVIKYNNQVEGGGGTSYIITDPSVFYNPQKYNWEQIMNRTKYPIMYEFNQ